MIYVLMCYESKHLSLIQHQYRLNTVTNPTILNERQDLRGQLLVDICDLSSIVR
jgi:hypothetical protein